MYPKQPFDFTGRTGTVAFDVTNDTSGAHGMWPEFWLTDQPVPAPWTHGDNGQVPCDFCSVPRNGIGIRLAGIFEPNQGGQAPGCVNDSNRRWIVDSMTIVRNYVPSNLGWYGTGSFTSLGCAIASSGPNGLLNHVEIRLSQTTVEVWASDPGQTTLKLIARLDNANLPLTRGLIWIEDSHYNAEKSNFPSTVNHTFTWDNVAFDGPATYRDLSFDVLDRLSTGNLPGTLNLGWDTMPGSPATLTTLPMTAQNIAAATGSLLLMNYGSAHINTWNYTINGHAHSTPTPIAAPISGWQSVALPIPLTDLVAGAQNIQISGDQYAGIANVSIVLVAAATVPGFNPPPAPTNLRLIGELLGLSGRKVWALGTSGLRSSQSYAAR
jgi:hypothetical protein